MSETPRNVAISIDMSVCVGSGVCAMIDPGNFRLEGGKARATSEETVLTDELEDALLECPVQAISREDRG
ncbi:MULTISPECIES: ferredoxin [unclassified Dietzia]|uniref:ferredoxin n=1 Tax=unclassified Dietzia TaxID=2617939 RepID=UPI000D208D6B|nr:MULTISPECIES: ferredoxin [unclassified Dietzia]AVZ40269.1 cytochrome [Dietzia sp. JS16-p6b]QGW25741.1 hypothetical protein GJR88_04163 [Dietzia sp. DQ12-45-1b]